jgi:molybdenum cofactor cytidylyltransferase
VTSVPGAAASHGSRVSVAAVVLAAGAATRMGTQKLLLPVNGRPMVQWPVDAALGSKASGTVVVVGHQAAQVVAALRGRPVTVVTNPDYAAGMSSSLRAGVLAAGACEAAVILLGDQPFVSAGLLDKLIDRFAETRASVVRPSLGDGPANPVLLSAALFPELLELRGDVGGREVVERHRDEVSLVPVDDPRVVADIDSIEDYEAAGGST